MLELADVVRQPLEQRCGGAAGGIGGVRIHLPQPPFGGVLQRCGFLDHTSRREKPSPGW